MMCHRIGCVVTCMVGLLAFMLRFAMVYGVLLLAQCSSLERLEGRGVAVLSPFPCMRTVSAHGHAAASHPTQLLVVASTLAVSLLCRPSFAEVSAVLEDLLQHEQQRQNVAVPKHLSHHQQQQWAAAAGLQTAAASAAPVAAQPREPDAGIVSALNKLLGPGPAASRASRPAQAAPAAVPAQHAATKAPRRQYSVTLAEPAGSDAPQPAAAAEFLLAPPLVATSTAAATAQGANSQQKEAGGNRARLSSIDGNDAAIRPRTGSSAGSAAARLNPRRRATIAAIAAVLDVKRPPAPGSSSSSSSGASLLQDAQQPRRAATRLDSVKEEVAE